MAPIKNSKTEYQKSTLYISRKRSGKIRHEKSIWTTAIELNLQPYALLQRNDIKKKLPDNEDATSPYDKFTGI